MQSDSGSSPPPPLQDGGYKDGYPVKKPARNRLGQPPVMVHWAAGRSCGVTHLDGLRPPAGIRWICQEKQDKVLLNEIKPLHML